MSKSSNPTAVLAVLALAALGAAASCRRPSLAGDGEQQLEQGRIHFALRGALLLRDRMQSSGLQFSSVRVMGDDGPICYTFQAPGSAQDRSAVLNDDSLVVSTQSSFAPLWQQFCLGKAGEEVAPQVLLGLAQHDKSPGR